jgi:hypothetical protein
VSESKVKGYLLREAEHLHLAEPRHRRGGYDMSEGPDLLEGPFAKTHPPRVSKSLEDRRFQDPLKPALGVPYRRRDFLGRRRLVELLRAGKEDRCADSPAREVIQRRRRQKHWFGVRCRW